MSTIQVRAPGRVRLTVEEFARIQDSGLFEGRHVQLLDGGGPRAPCRSY